MAVVLRPGLPGLPGREGLMVGIMMRGNKNRPATDETTTHKQAELARMQSDMDQLRDLAATIATEKGEQINQMCGSRAAPPARAQD